MWPKQWIQKSAMGHIQNSTTADPRSGMTSLPNYDTVSSPKHTYSNWTIATEYHIQLAMWVYRIIILTWSRDQLRWPNQCSGFENSRKTHILVWMTVRPAWKKYRWCMAMRTWYGIWQCSTWPTLFQDQIHGSEFILFELKNTGRSVKAPIGQQVPRESCLEWVITSTQVWYRAPNIKNGIFYNIKVFFNHATDSEFKLDRKNPRKSHPHQQQ